MQRIFIDSLVANAEERESFFPSLLTLLTIGNRDCRVAVIVAIDPPFESEREQCRRFGDELLDGCLIRGR
jgi:hypothetical protein